jgi:hypothetical protein
MSVGVSVSVVEVCLFDSLSEECAVSIVA